LLEGPAVPVLGVWMPRDFSEAALKMLTAARKRPRKVLNKLNGLGFPGSCYFLLISPWLHAARAYNGDADTRR